MLRIRDLRCFAELGRYFLMLKLFADESYNKNTICMGGWLAHEDVWKDIERDLLARIAYENCMSAKRGLRPISRYHAADCANLKNEFKEWDIPRQIRLSKCLIDILGQQARGLYGIGYGVSLDDFSALFDDRHAKEVRRACYRMCVAWCLQELCSVMKRDYPGERVSIFHESGDYVAEAQYAFQRFGNCGGQFVTLAPLNWQEAPALQVADFIAYEIMKTSHKRLEGEDAVRKTLQAMMGKKIPAAFAYLPRGGFRELKAMMEQGQ